MGAVLQDFFENSCTEMESGVATDVLYGIVGTYYT